MSKFHYIWKMSDGYPAKSIPHHKTKVFSCFACGGGSTMGYKLAGYDVVGCNEIDKRMFEMYVANHKPKYAFNEAIQDFKKRKGYPKELYNIDVLDGSPPCSSFSMSGIREKGWGKKKKFREGQEEQVLDTLFFDFLDFADRIKPKIIIAENVEGMTFGAAKEYVKAVADHYRKIGYAMDVKLYNSCKMGVPQSRKRVFFYAIRKDLLPIVGTCDLFGDVPALDSRFNFPVINFSEISEETNKTENLTQKEFDAWDVSPEGQPVGPFGTNRKMIWNRPTYCVTSGKMFHPRYRRYLSDAEIIKAQSFPTDYNYNGNKVIYVCGMSVPPVMMANFSYIIYEQWIKKIKEAE